MLKKICLLKNRNKSRFTIFNLILLFTLKAFAIPTISMPDLIMEKNINLPVTINGSSPISADVVRLPATIRSNLDQFSADIRGAIINSGQFRVVDVQNINIDNLASVDSVLGKLQTNSGISKLQGVSTEFNGVDLTNVATTFADNLIKSNKLAICESYVVIDNSLNQNSDNQDFLKAFINELDNSPDFSSKYLLDGTNNTKSDCQIITIINEGSNLYNGINNINYQISVKLIKSSSSNVLWQQQTNIKTVTDYYLVGIIHDISQNEDSYPIKNTNNMTKQYFIEVSADFKLVRAKDNKIMASFSANGVGRDVKIVNMNSQNVTWHHNIGKLVSDASKDLAQNVVTQMLEQFKYAKDPIIKKTESTNVVTDVKVYH